MAFGAESANLGQPPCCQRDSIEHPRVAMTNSMCNCGRDSTRPAGPATDRYGDAHTSRFVRPLAGCATLISIEELVLVAQNVRAGAAVASVVGFRRWPRRTAGRGLGSLSWFGDGVDQSVVAPWSSVECGVRGRPSAIASPGSLQRQPRRHGDEPRAQITKISNKNDVYWGFGVQIYANPSRNDPPGAGSAGSTAGSTGRTPEKSRRRRTGYRPGGATSATATSCLDGASC